LNVGVTSIVLTLCAGLAIFVVYIDARIAASVDFETAKTTIATVVSVAEIKPVNPLKADDSDRLYKVCFTIDNFDQIAAVAAYGENL